VKRTYHEIKQLGKDFLSLFVGLWSLALVFVIAAFLTGVIVVGPPMLMLWLLKLAGFLRPY
jgi:hypothetical protein